MAYARVAAKSQPIYGELAAGTIKSAYNFALSDWFNPPVIHHIERRDGLIHVEATDNVMVTRVVVTILDGDGKAVKQGEAVKIDERWWKYAASTQGMWCGEFYRRNDTCPFNRFVYTCDNRIPKIRISLKGTYAPKILRRTYPQGNY